MQAGGGPWVGRANSTTVVVADRRREDRGAVLRPVGAGGAFSRLPRVPSRRTSGLHPWQPTVAPTEAGTAHRAVAHCSTPAGEPTTHRPTRPMSSAGNRSARRNDARPCPRRQGAPVRMTGHRKSSALNSRVLSVLRVSAFPAGPRAAPRILEPLAPRSRAPFWFVDFSTF